MRSFLIFLLYRALLIAAAPLIVAYLFIRGLRDRRYFQSMPDRLGFFPRSHIPTVSGGIWLHAVSVGEILSSVQLIRRLRDELHAPVYVTVSTLAGRAVADEKLRGIASAIHYAPLDYAWIVRRFLRRWRPSVVLVMETEIWPNLYREAKRSGASLLIANGRISNRALPRYLRWKWFFADVLLIPDRILVQSEIDAKRYLDAGAPSDRVGVAGNLKYDFDARATSIAPDIRSFLDHHPGAKVWIAASTMPPAQPGDPDEDDAVIEAMRYVSDALLIVVPRKPERFSVAVEKLKAAGVPFVRRTALPAADARSARVLLLDTMGELSALFAIADVVFMGGTLANRGGHNILEPAFFGRPVICGPHMENFADVAERFDEAGACVRIPAASELGPTVRRLLDNSELRGSIGERARQTAEAQRGATSRVIDAIRELRDEAIPIYRRSLPARVMLWPLCVLWIAGGALKRHITKTEHLSRPVISMGGLAMGGTGKTPLVAWLAARLHANGKRVAILTRGYKRSSSEPVVVLRGQTAPPQDTGDEAQIFIRKADADVGIGSDRVSVGRTMEQQLNPEVFLLDDGFQHAKLARDVDVVLIDSLNPFAGGVFPVGRLREPWSALRRASIVVITRTERDREYAALKCEISRFTPAPIFLAGTVALGWKPFNASDAPRCELLPASALSGKEVVALCGLGNPAAFAQTLDELNVRVTEWHVFPDHHKYTSNEFASIAATASVIVTTEKDAMNLPSQQPAVPIYVLKIATQIDDEEAFLRACGADSPLHHRAKHEA